MHLLCVAFTVPYNVSVYSRNHIRIVGKEFGGQRVLYIETIGLASVTSQLDRNAWQRVAAYKSGSKQTWRGIFFVWNHIEKAQTHRTPAQLPLCCSWPATARFSCLLSSGSDSVLDSKFLWHVSGSSSRIRSLSIPALLPWRRPVEAKHVVFLGCFLCGGLLIAHSSWSLDRENSRNKETKTSSSYFDVEWFPYPHPSIDVCTPARLDTGSPYSTQTLPNPTICSIMSQ